MVADDRQPPEPRHVEPLARLLRAVRDAAGLKDADIARLTGLNPQHVSQLVNRLEPYKAAPLIRTQQALARIPGLDLSEIAAAIQESTGTQTRVVDDTMSRARKHAHSMIDDFSEDELPRVLQVLLALTNGR